MCVCEREYVCTRVRVRVYACVCACARVCLCVRVLCACCKSHKPHQVWCILDVPWGDACILYIGVGVRMGRAGGGRVAHALDVALNSKHSCLTSVKWERGGERYLGEIERGGDRLIERDLGEIEIDHACVQVGGGEGGKGEWWWWLLLLL